MDHSNSSSLIYVYDRRILLPSQNTGIEAISIYSLMRAWIRDGSCESSVHEIDRFSAPIKVLRHESTEGTVAGTSQTIQQSFPSSRIIYEERSKSNTFPYQSVGIFGNQNLITFITSYLPIIPFLM